MKIVNSYPYPVLSDFNDDYIDSELIVEYNTQEQFGELKISAEFLLKNQGLTELIKNGDALFMLHLECPQTSYRKIYTSKEREFNESIKISELRGKIFLHSYIVANKEIKDYRNTLWSEWYKGINVRFEKGSFMGIGNASEITLHDENIEFMDLPSIIDIHKGLKKEYMEVELHASNIIITLPESQYESYANNGGTRLKNTIISAVIFPGLIYVFSKMQENRRDLEEYTWYQVMESIFEENNFNIEDVGTEKLSALQAAQLVLKKPLESAFKEIEKFNSMEGSV